MNGMHFEIATFAAGCFWGVEAVFRDVKGVEDTRVGYTGGVTTYPSYEDVCTGTTGHVEAVELKFCPDITTFANLLEIFFRIHNPTLNHQQVLNAGSQYRSAIFYHNKEQQAAAIHAKQQLEQSNRFSQPILTEIYQAASFFPAEEYHQRYYEKHGQLGCLGD